MTVTVYADSNIYRYMANGELEITSVGAVRFAYSSAHFDEILRTGNTDMLKGIETLKAVPLVSNENGEYDIDSVGVCLAYEDPYDKYQKYKDSIRELSIDETPMYELLLYFLGADNHSELEKLPDHVIELAKEGSTGNFVGDADLLAKAVKASDELIEYIDNEWSEPIPITKTRTAFGYPKGATSKHEDAEDPIEEMWNIIRDKFPEITKDELFGFQAPKGVDIQLGRLSSISACHMVLNMLGYNPDNGLSKREKIKNIISDGHHLGFASLCGAFITSDYRLFKKAKAIFKYQNYPLDAVYIPYKSEGMSEMIVEPGVIKRFKCEPINGRNKPNQNDA